ncbi:MAG: hypothetical protein SOT34_06090 [Candidatus Borkfalkiaceae bacterium]|nr:hypothetical protein [Christensenellaceae bacterium]
MKDGMDYAEMLGLPVSSCDVVIRPASRKRRRDAKDEVIAKINAERENVSAGSEEAAPVPDAAEDGDGISPGVRERKKKGFLGKTRLRKRAEEKSSGKDAGFRFDAVYAEGVAVFVLVVAILLTNIFWENSGMNVLFRKIMGTDTAAADTRAYTGFSPRSPSSELNVSLAEGVMTYSGKGALYPVCDGFVSSVTEEEGKYTVVVRHSDVFKTVIEGVDYVYADKGDEVFRYIPVCYIDGGEAKVSLYDSDVLLTSYVIENGAILWES